MWDISISGLLVWGSIRLANTEVHLSMSTSILKIPDPLCFIWTLYFLSCLFFNVTRCFPGQCNWDEMSLPEFPHHDLQIPPMGHVQGQCNSFIWRFIRWVCGVKRILSVITLKFEASRWLSFVSASKEITFMVLGIRCWRYNTTQPPRKRSGTDKAWD